MEGLRETAAGNVVVGRVPFSRVAAVVAIGAVILGGAVSAQAPRTSVVTNVGAAPVARATTATSTPTPPAVPDAAKRYRAPRDVGAVAAPVRLEIPALSIESDLERVGKRTDDTIDVPKRPARAAWYVDSAPPGQPGAAVMLGHVDSKKGPAVFYRLHELRRGSAVIVYRADGSAVRFVVDKVEQHSKDAFPGVDVYFPTVRPTLRLITCGGNYVRSAGGYQANVIVFASLARGAS